MIITSKVISERNGFWKIEDKDEEWLCWTIRFRSQKKNIYPKSVFMKSILIIFFFLKLKKILKSRNKIKNSNPVNLANPTTAQRGHLICLHFSCIDVIILYPVPRRMLKVRKCNSHDWKSSYQNNFYLWGQFDNKLSTEMLHYNKHISL